MRLRDVARKAFGLLPLLVFPGSAAGLVVEFDSTYAAGVGSAGNPFSYTQRIGARPRCNQGLAPHATGAVPGHGVAELGSSAPRSLRALRPFQYGTPNPTANVTVVAKPGAPGPNGMARYAMSTCAVAIPTSLLGPAHYTEFSSFAAPAEFEITTSTTASGMRIFQQGSVREEHRVGAGLGPGNRTVSVPTPTAGVPLMAVLEAGAARFGGGWRASGAVQKRLGVNASAGIVIELGWLSGPHMVGHNRATPTQIVTATGFATNLATMGYAPITVMVWNLPFTTGRVRAIEQLGTISTVRTATGGDNRSGPNSSMGTLQLVSPWIANVTPPFWGIRSAGTATLTFEFLPEPAGTLSALAGITAVLVLHRLARRQASRRSRTG